jgi:predicted methyltransferase
MTALRLAAVAIVFASVCAVSAQASPIPNYISAAVADQARPEKDKARDADRKPAETVVFAGVKPGMTVGELMPGGGYYTRILSKVVGPKGHVYAITGEEILARMAKAADASKAIAADPAYGNVSAIVEPVASVKAPERLDLVWTTQNYHDLHIERSFGKVDMTAFDKSVYAALKPGGIFFVLDHAAAPGATLADIAKLHRIDEAMVKKEVEAAGFKLESESNILRNPADPHTATVFDASIRGHTDQFMLRFRKPKE